MILSTNNNVFVYLIISVIFILILLLLPIEIPYTIRTTGKILPAKEWAVSKGTDGRLIMSLTNNIEGNNESYSFHLFERGDDIHFQLANHLFSGSSVKTGDTIAFLNSNTIERKLIELKGELEVAESTLQVYQTGEKLPLVEEARQKMNFAIEDAEFKSKLFERQKELVKKRHISEEEFDIAMNDYLLSQINIEIAKSQYKNLTTGAKKEQIEFVKSQINKLNNDINELKTKMNSYSVTSPICGKSYHLLTSDTLIIVGDTSQFIIVIPLKWHQKPHIDLEEKVKAVIPQNGITLYASVVSVNESIYRVDNEPIYLLIAAIDNKEISFLPGLQTKCYLYGGKLNIRDYIFNFILKLYDRVCYEIGI